MGRPAFNPPPSLRHDVELLITAGTNERDAAKAIGCDRSTLRKYFTDEILNARARMRRQVISQLWTQARRGKFSAIRELLRLSESSKFRSTEIGKTQPKNESEQ